MKPEKFVSIILITLVVSSEPEEQVDAQESVITEIK